VSAWLILTLMLALGQPAPGSPPEDEEAQPPPPPVQAVPAPPVGQPVAQPEISQPAAAPGEVTDGPAGNQPMDALTRRPVVRPFEMPAFVPVGPQPYAPSTGGPPPSEVTAPVVVEHYVRSYERPRDEIEQAYDRGVRQHFDNEQGLMGPLDGVWTVTGANGEALYVVVVNEPGMNGGIEAAWRDLHKGHGANAAGVAEYCVRDGQALSLEFQQDDRVRRTSLRLRRSADGQWRGELDDQGRRQTVTLVRTPTPA
jgi:hypothetical protein